MQALFQPAKAALARLFVLASSPRKRRTYWISACAGMTTLIGIEHGRSAH
jgi:hypothetical protein